MDMRVCSNGHETPILYRPCGRLRCIECERERCRRYYRRSGGRRDQAAWKRKRRALEAAGWV